MSYIEPVRLVGRDQDGPGTSATDPIGAGSTVQARDVFELVVSGGDGFPAVSRATARRWIADALGAGLIVREGSTSRTVYGLPDPGTDPPIPDAEPDDVDTVDRSTRTATSSPIDAEPWETDPPDPPPRPARRYWEKLRDEVRSPRPGAGDRATVPKPGAPPGDPIGPTAPSGRQRRSSKTRVEP